MFCDNRMLERISLGNLEEMGDSCFCQLPSLKEIAILETLQTLSRGSFNDCKSLERITLPSSQALCEGVFNKCPAIREELVYAATPYPFPDNCMADTDKSKCTLYVPEGSEQAYASADGWKDFGTIAATLKTNMNTVNTDGEWRALPSHGSLLVDSTIDGEIAIHNAAGQLISKVNRKGRTEIPLPTGIYIVSSQGKSAKVKIN